MSYQIKLSLPLPDDQLKAIGRVTANWTMIEHSLERYIWFLISMGYDVGMCVTTHMSFPQRLDAVLSLSHDTFASFRQDQIEALRKYANELRNQIYPKRNQIVHAVWETNNATGNPIIVKRTARGELKEETLAYTAKEINDIADEISSAFVRLNELLLDLEPEDKTGQKPPSWLDNRHWDKGNIKHKEKGISGGRHAKPSRNYLIEQKYREGASVASLAAEFGISTSRVRQVLNNLEGKRRRSLPA